MSNVQGDTEVFPGSVSDSEDDLTKPQLMPIQTTGLTSDGPDEALAFDEPSSALASRVLSAHGNPSPPPSPLRGAEVSLMPEQLSVSPIRATRMLPVNSTQLGSESGSRDASDAEVENSLVLMSPLLSEGAPIPTIQEPFIIPGPPETTTDDDTSGSSVPTQDAIPSECPQPEQPEQEQVAEAIEETAEMQKVPQQQPSPEAESAPLAADQVPLPQGIEQLQAEPEAQSPRRSTRPRRSTAPFTLQAFTSLPGTPLRGAEKQPSQRPKARMKTPEKGSPKIPLDVTALKIMTSEEKKQRRKERAKTKEEQSQQDVGLLSPGSSALLSQLLPSQSAEDINPFDDSATAPAPPESTPQPATEASDAAGPSHSQSQVEPNEVRLDAPSTPSRFPIRPSRPSNIASPMRSPSPRRIPLNQAPASVRKVRFPESDPRRLQAPLLAPPLLDSPTRKSPVKPTRTTPAQPISVEASPLPPLPVPESSNAPQLPFPLIASKPLSQPEKSRAPVSTSVERHPPSRIPRIASKPYSNRNNASTSTPKMDTASPEKHKPVLEHPVPRIHATSPAPEPSTSSITASVASSASPLKRKRESAVPESLFPKRTKLQLGGETDTGQVPVSTSPQVPPVSSVVPIIPSQGTVEPQTAESNQPPPSSEAPVQKDRSPSPPGQSTSQPRRTGRVRKTAQVPKTTTPVLPPAPRQRKPPATRLEPETFAGLTIAAFRQLTTTNTTKNQEYVVANIETEVIRIQGPRPDSPTTKVRTSLQQKQREEANEERSARAERRARRSGDITEDEAENQSTSEEPEQVSTPPRKHARGPGEEEEYETPKRIKHADEGETENDVEERRVRWDRGLSTTIYLDELHPKGKAQSDAIIKKGCLANSSKTLIEKLDALGNVPEVNEKMEDLVREQVVVKKFIYDEDIPDPDPEPAPAKATRSKAKK